MIFVLFFMVKVFELMTNKVKQNERNSQQVNGRTQTNYY